MARFFQHPPAGEPGVATGPAAAGEHRPASEPAPAAGAGLKPSAMRGNEQRYGYAVAVVLVAMSLLNLTVTHGKGAPAHPATTLSVIGLVVSLGLFAALQTKSRLIVPFSAVIAAFFVDLPPVPNTLTTAHLVALLIPVAYALWLTQHQRKAQAGARGPRARQTPAERRAQAESSRQARRRGGSSGRDRATSGPTANRRYTPPKTRRGRR